MKIAQVTKTVFKLQRTCVNMALRLGSGHELKNISDLNRLHELPAMQAPARSKSLEDVFLDDVSLAVCVRVAAPPLRLTRVILHVSMGLLGNHASQK